MRSKSQCFNIIHLAIGFTAGRLTLVTAQIALPLRYPFTPNGPRRLLLGTKRTGRSITYDGRKPCPLLRQEPISLAPNVTSAFDPQPTSSRCDMIVGLRR